MIREDNDKISPYQLYVIYVSAILGVGSTSMPRELAESGDTNGWIAILVTGIIVSLMSYIMYYINKKLDKPNFLEVSKALVGNVLSYIIAFAFIAYCLIISAFETKEVTEVIKNFMYKSTPTTVISIGIIFVACYSISGGIETIAKIFEILIIISAVIIVLSIVIIVPQADFSNLLPVMQIKPIKFFDMVLKTLPGFAGFELLLLFLPMTNYKTRTKKQIFLGTLTVAFFFLIFDILVIGKYGVEFTKILKWPDLNLMKDVYIKNSFIENPQIVAMTALIFAGFTTLVAYLYGAVSLTRFIFKPKKQYYVIIIMAVLTYIIYTIPGNYGLEENFKNFVSNYCIPFAAFLIPLILFIVLIIKERRGSLSEIKH